MHIRFIIYLSAAALFLISGLYFGFREILPWLGWAVALMIAGELGALYKRKKYRDDK